MEVGGTGGGRWDGGRQRARQGLGVLACLGAGNGRCTWQNVCYAPVIRYSVKRLNRPDAKDKSEGGGTAKKKKINI